MQCRNAFGYVCLCVFPVRILTVKSLDLESGMLVDPQNMYTKMIRSRSISQQQKVCLSVLFVL